MKLTLKIEGMTCLDCARRLEQAVSELPGVERAEVSYPTQRASVLGSDAVDADDVLRAIAETGYGAQVVEDEAAVQTVDAPEERAATTDVRVPTGAGSDYDLVIIGSGSAGMAAAIRASELGASAAVVEGGEVVGGTCVNVGCIPSKNLIEAAHHYHTARTAFPGITACEPALAWSHVLRQKRELVEQLRRDKYVDVLKAHEGVTLLRGRAQLLGGGRVQLGDREVTASRIIIATGTRPSMPPIPGLDEAGALDSTTVMELEELPESMIVLGGGAVGLELAQAFARFGVRVIVIEALDRIVPGEDPDTSEAVTEALRAEGIEIHVAVKATHVSRDHRGYTVEVEGGSTMTAQQLFVATGRRPNVEDLGLDAAGVSTDERGFIDVDEFMRTSSAEVYAAGDVTGGPGFVYVAALQGGIAAQAALAEITGEDPIAIDLSATPRVTFTDPQIAAVGMTDQEARAAGHDVDVTSMPAEYLPRALVSYRTRGMFKLVSESGTGRLLGAHIVAPNAGDIISEAVLAVRFSLTAQDVVSTMHPYLTWAEGVKLAAQTFTKDVARLSCCA